MFRLLVFSLLFSSISSSAQQLEAGFGCRMNKQHNLATAAAEATNSEDSVHIQHYDIRIDSLNFGQQQIWGITQLTIESKVDGLSVLRLSLDGFVVDSALDGNGQALSHSYDNLNLAITLPNTLNLAETDTLTVVYHGNPAEDSSWGGFYWNGSSYAFNMGVGFDEDPHVFGRAWFPCLDVFTDRATYDFHIRTVGDYQAFCNGELTQVEDHGNGTRTFHWELLENIPTYLASMAVAEYHFLERTYSGIPTVWAALPQDTVSVLNTFLHLPEALDAFISSYGPYRWNKVGYALVPFNAGAMEHASSIHIGKPFVNGSLTYETLWAHELSHMWWGDLVTCKNQENMWLNEGFASYSEALFTEAVYGVDAYKDWIRENHRKVLQFSHISDGAYYAMNAIPGNVTYGSTVYDKGPEVIHTLRNFMGDELFFAACNHYMDSLAFGNADSYDLRNIFAASSGLDLEPFFDGWVFQPGFPHFQIDSYTVTPIQNSYEVEVHLRQKQRANSHIYGMNIPINLSNGTDNVDQVVQMNEETQNFTITCPFEPSMVTIDRWEQMSDAVADFEMDLSTTGNHTFNQTNVSVDVQNVGTKTSIVRIEDHFVQPDGFIGVNPGIAINPYHYWSVDGVFAQGFAAEATFKYNGSNNTSQGYMDNELIVDTEDSLIFLYRSGVGQEWEEVDNYEMQTGVSVTNKIGTVRIDSLKRGEYVLARRDFAAGINDFHQDEKSTFVYPNPNSGVFNLILPEGKWDLELFDVSGKRIANWNVTNGQEIRTSNLSNGHYLISATKGNQRISQSLIIQ